MTTDTLYAMASADPVWTTDFQRQDTASQIAIAESVLEEDDQRNWCVEAESLPPWGTAVEEEQLPNDPRFAVEENRLPHSEDSPAVYGPLYVDDPPQYDPLHVHVYRVHPYDYLWFAGSVGHWYDPGVSPPFLSGVVSDKYKTQLCRNQEEVGVCKFGNQCHFAHGVNELRATSKPPNYKTKLCKKYHEEGLCMYGTRCVNIH